MSQRQQALLQALSKYCQKYFLYKRVSHREDAKVRYRDDLHLAEQHAPGEQTQKIRRRVNDMAAGLFTPVYENYRPVAGWPVIDLDQLVLNAMAEQMDPEVWSALYKHFAKPEVARKKTRNAELKDGEDLQICPTAGFSQIKTHIKESDMRIPAVCSGYPYEEHFRHTREARIKQENPPEGDGMVMYTEEQPAKIIMRLRRDEIKFLEAINQLINTLMMIKVRHLKSTEPIRLKNLGTEEDKEQEMQYNQNRRLLRKPGVPLKPHLFKEQIIMDAPPGWNANVAHGMTARHSRLETKPSRQLHLPVKQSPSAYRQNSAQNVKRRNSNLLPSIEQGVPAKGRSSDQASRARNSSRSIPVEKGKEKDTVKDNEVSAMYRKPWPPLWMSIAAAEQEETDEGELKMPKMPQILAAQRSAMGNDIYLEDIKQERKQWARSRQKIEKLAEERLKRADIEKMERFHLNISTLRGIPFQRQFNHQYAIMQELTSRSRRERQKKVLYDCEITGWYRTLEEEEWEKLGETDEEVNARLEDIKQHFKLSPKRPIYVRAKMALMVMSMPATEICQICVQRALQYLLVEVLLMPPETLSQWLALRGLPMVLVNAFDNSDI